MCTRRLRSHLHLNDCANNLGILDVSVVELADSFRFQLKQSLQCFVYGNYMCTRRLGSYLHLITNDCANNFGVLDVSVVELADCCRMLSICTEEIKA